MWKQKAVSGSRQAQLGSYLAGLMYLLLASAWACSEALAGQELGKQREVESWCLTCSSQPDQGSQHVARLSPLT